MTDLVKDNLNVYQFGKLYATPYPTESVLAMAFLRMERDGLLDIVFHESCQGVGWFINEFSKRQSILMCWVRTRDSGRLEQDLDLAGMAWFNQRWKIGESGQAKAEAGYVFFREFQKPKITLPLAAVCMDWAFDHLGVDLILGMTPEANKLACYFLRWLGMRPSGPIEHFTTYPAGGPICGAYISTMTKDRWQDTRKKWFDTARPINK